MKLLSSIRYHYIARVSIFLITLALIAGIAGCGPVQYTLNITSTTGGNVTTPGVGTHTYDAGTVVNLTAEADEGYRFVNWAGDVGTIGNVTATSTNITMNGNHSITANFEEGEAVTFPDPNLEAAIREAIGKPTGPIYPSDLEGLTSFSARERNITNLTGLEHCTNLTSLDLGYNQIGNISPLAGLTNLLYLNLDGNQIGDISSLAGLMNLQGLLLVGNQVSDISSLASLTKLNGLQLADNHIGNISVLAQLTNLQALYLDGNQISDISPLVQNVGLSTGDHVFLSGNPLSSDSINIYIPELQTRGVTVYY